jgi:hypothetical protein
MRKIVFVALFVVLFIYMWGELAASTTIPKPPFGLRPARTVETIVEIRNLNPD